MEISNGGIDNTGSIITIKGMLSLLMQSVDDEKNEKKVISLAMGDPTVHSCFHTTHVATEAVAEALLSEKFNGYAPTAGLPLTRRAIAEYLSRDLPYKLTPNDVFVTSGCTQAIDVAMALLSRPGANILLPRPGFPIYELSAAFRHIEVRHFDLLPDKGWEVDLDDIESLADQNTVALVIINPGNPCGNVYSYQHLQKIAETANKLKTLVIADEVYGHLVFGDKLFVPMGVFGSTVPILTLGSLSKRWIVPGWRLGWFVTTDPCGMFRKPKVVERMKKYFDILGGPATFIQLKLNLSLLDDIIDDIDFCFKLAKEESVIILPGTAVGLKNWLRVTFAVDPYSLEECLDRIKSFYQRHAKQLQRY
ncbi:putative aminotransferase TAT2 [Citrus sinensis]|uniref:probable aminotransferase TAT2 isoform X2 n=1 Tax=Citrus sinensis TaxID=2711 RepID=UPI00219E8DEE|nr:probable aminotransferase TAT2 isoform X2 [Citrus sinensis]KAH9763929.1 putative aminotransferase TAT2 [Citrus sinensis]